MTRATRGAKRIDPLCGTSLDAGAADHEVILAAHGPRSHWHARPDTVLEALMVAGTEEPAISKEERVELQDLVCDVFDKLSTYDRWLIDMLVNARLSLRFVAIVVGIPKTTLARRRDAIYDTMRKELADNETVKAYLGRY
ncbi:MAG: hypothetical protein QGF59_03565 [Pirellulaceae bacterium]|nr:hypothetical protein [Pirellulaceae bacterium]